MLLDGDSTNAKCSVWSHLICFKFLKLKTCDLESYCVSSFCIQSFVNLMFKNLQFMKLETRQLPGNGLINIEKMQFSFFAVN